MTDERIMNLILDLRRMGISDKRVLSAMESTPRDLFVEKPFRDRAFDNSALPIENGQTISQPYVVAYMAQELELNPRSRVLEVGTGSGYHAAVLSKLCKRVYTIERYRNMNRIAEQRFKSLGIENIVTLVGDGYGGWPEPAPYDRILTTAAAPKVPQNLLDQLAPDGVLVMPVGIRNNTQRLIKVRRTDDGFVEEYLIPVVFVPMVEGIAR